MTSAGEDKAEDAKPVIAMRGAGYYSANTLGAKMVIDAAADLVLESLDGLISTDATTPLSFADYGAADGGTSIDMWRKAIAHVRGSAPARPIMLTYTDLPHNDFSALFQMLHG